MPNEMPWEPHDSDAEKDGCWCGICGSYHSGECPDEDSWRKDDDDE